MILTALRDERGEVVGFAKVTRDLTERRAAETQAVWLAGESAARDAAEARPQELDTLNQQLQEQAIELEAQAEEAQDRSRRISRDEQAARGDARGGGGSAAAAESSERFAREILDSIADPFVVQDAEWRFRYINAKAAQILGESGTRPDELIGKVVWDVYPRARRHRDRARDASRGGERIPVAFESADARTGSRWSSLYCYPLPGRRPRHAVEDITERKRAEEAAQYLARASEVLGDSLDYSAPSPTSRSSWCPSWPTGAAWRSSATMVVSTARGRARRSGEGEVGAGAEPPVSARTPMRPPVSPNVIRTGEPELYPEIPDEMLVAGAVDEEHLRIIREVGIRSAIVVPLVAHDRTLGAVTLIAAESGRRYGASGPRTGARARAPRGARGGQRETASR